MKTLVEIQSKLKAPKGQFNKFGNYKYRSCEDIVEAVKPILAELDCALILTDEVVTVGDRFYVKATAKIVSGEETYETTAYAREEESKKGMDGAQITGSASSYARKYALNGLFAIDDTKDADATNDHKDKETLTYDQERQIEALLHNALIDDKKRASIENYMHGFTPKRAEEAIKYLRENQDSDPIGNGKGYGAKAINKKLDEVMSDERK